MLRKVLFGVLCVALMLGTAQGTMITKIVAEQTIGVSSDYANGTVDWGQGATGTIYYSNGTNESFSTTATVAGYASGAFDSSSGGQAHAVFTGGGNVGVTLAEVGGDGISFSLYGLIPDSGYREDEMINNYIVGDGVLTDFTATFGTGWFGGTTEALQWAGGNSAVMRTDILLSTTFGDYDTDTYFTQNTTLTIMAPEPATLTLLSVAGLALLRKRKR